MKKKFLVSGDDRYTISWLVDAYPYSCSEEEYFYKLIVARNGKGVTTDGVWCRRTDVELPDGDYLVHKKRTGDYLLTEVKPNAYMKFPWYVVNVFDNKEAWEQLTDLMPISSAIACLYALRYVVDARLFLPYLTKSVDDCTLFVADGMVRIQSARGDTILPIHQGISKVVDDLINRLATNGAGVDLDNDLISN